jgi:hypothetical protein
VHPCLQRHNFLFFSRPFAPPARPLSLRHPKFKIQKPQKNAMTLVRPLATSVANSKFSTHQVHPCLHGHHFLFWSRPFAPPAGPLSLRRPKFKIQKPQKNAMTLVRPLAASVANSKFSTHQVHPCLQGHHFLFWSRPFGPPAGPLSLRRQKFKIQKPQKNVMTLVRPLAASVANSKFPTNQFTLASMVTTFHFGRDPLFHPQGHFR